MCLSPWSSVTNNVHPVNDYKKLDRRSLRPHDGAMTESVQAASAEEPRDSTTEFQSPHPGVASMPRWDTADLVEPPRFTIRNWFAMLGPGLVMGAAAIGGGEWLLGPTVTARYGGALLWLATLSIAAQCLYNIEISRYTLYCGEPIFTGKFRTFPGPKFWAVVYILLDYGSIFPYLAASAATPVVVMLLGGHLPNPDASDRDWWLVKGIGCAVFLGSMLPLIVGGKVYNSLKVVMSFKLVTVFGFLIVLGVLYSHSSTWVEIGTGFFKFGSVPVQRGEDANGNGLLDPGEDWDGDGRLDEIEAAIAPSIDADGDGIADTWETDDQGAPIKFVDLDGDGRRDGENIENIFVSLFSGRGFPDVDFTLIAFIAGLAAIAGNGGLSNTPISNFTRDQGWGMGYHVGAIPSIVGGRGISLSHVGAVFQVDDESLPRWKRWYRYMARDQAAFWMPACFIGVALPSMLSVEFLNRGTDADKWNMAALTAEGVGQQVASPADDVVASMTGLSDVLYGPAWGNLFWAMTLFCGFLVLAPSMAATIDGVIRRWVDVFWTANAQMRKMDPTFIKHVYFRVLIAYGCFGLVMLWLNEPSALIKISTIGYNFALGFSCWHTLAVNTILLPRPLRPRWPVRIGLSLAGSFFFILGVLAALKELGAI